VERSCARSAIIAALANSRVNPDCGLKTRKWADVTPALVNRVEAAISARAALA